MGSLNNDNSLLLTQFRSFHGELRRVMALIQNSQSAISANENAEVSAISVQSIWQRLLSVLEMQALESGRIGGGLSYEVYREAQYVMAALADELLIRTEWFGRGSWPLLETRLFRSHASGEIFFRRLDRILAERDKAYSDLALIYFYALALGFRGKYGDGDDRGELERYRHRLFVHLYRRPPDDLEGPQPIFPQAYLPTVNEVEGRRFPMPQVWMLAIVIVLCLWVGISHALWRSTTASIYAQIELIKKTAHTLGDEDSKTTTALPKVAIWSTPR